MRGTNKFFSSFLPFLPSLSLLIPCLLSFIRSFIPCLHISRAASVVGGSDFATGTGGVVNNGGWTLTPHENVKRLANFDRIITVFKAAGMSATGGAGSGGSTGGSTGGDAAKAKADADAKAAADKAAADKAQFGAHMEGASIYGGYLYATYVVLRDMYSRTPHHETHTHVHTPYTTLPFTAPL